MSGGHTSLVNHGSGASATCMRDFSEIACSPARPASHLKKCNGCMSENLNIRPQELTYDTVYDSMPVKLASPCTSHGYMASPITHAKTPIDTTTSPQQAHSMRRRPTTPHVLGVPQGSHKIHQGSSIEYLQESTEADNTVPSQPQLPSPRHMIAPAP